MASELIVQTIQGPSSGANANKVLIPSGHTLDVSGGTLLPSAGAVVQVKHVENTSHISVSASGNISLGLSITLTPISSTSTFLLLAKVQSNIQTGTGGFGAVWKRNGSNISVTDLEVYMPTSGLRSSSFFQHYDTPATSSPITYELYADMFSADTIEFNEDSSRGLSNLTVMEIAG